MDRIPPLTIVAQNLCDPNLYEANQQAIDLLYWVLVHLKDSRMKSVPKSEVMRVK